MLSPFAWLQRWPFCYWVAVAMDHFSRKAMGFAVFTKAPTAKEVTAFLGRAIRTVGRGPRYVISDRGKQFDCDVFRT
jgi:transposase InsO family protein